MTSEIVLMNRRAVVLAADSATTTSYYDTNQRQWKTRYFKGANKIFNLSNYFPVGMMTYDSANVHGVPWEVVAKAFRDYLGGQELDHLGQYAQSLFEFIQSNKDIFPEDHLRERFLDRVENVATLLIAFCLNDSKVVAAKKQSDKKAAATDCFRQSKKRIGNSQRIGGITDAEVEETISELKEAVVERIKDIRLVQEGRRFVDIAELAEWSLRGYYAEVVPGHETTGLAFAGYGKREYFPVVKTFMSYGIARGRAVYREGNEERMTPNDVSKIVPLAKTQMVNTFIYGISDASLHEIATAFNGAIEAFAQDLVSRGLLAEDADTDKIKTDVQEKFSDKVVELMIDTHSHPLRRVVGSLPVDELADLAETLVALESLKERVTTDEESVGGPIDVAAISKGDGFVWIKRKHYFDSSLNPRFMAKLGAKYDG